MHAGEGGSEAIKSRAESGKSREDSNKLTVKELLVSLGCCNALAQDNRNMFSYFWSLESEVMFTELNLSRGVDKALLHLEVLGRSHSLDLPASGGPRHFLAYGLITLFSASVVKWPSPHCSHNSLFLSYNVRSYVIA